MSLVKEIARVVYEHLYAMGYDVKLDSWKSRPDGAVINGMVPLCDGIIGASGAARIARFDDGCVYCRYSGFAGTWLTFDYSDPNFIENVTKHLANVVVKRKGYKAPGEWFKAAGS